MANYKLEQYSSVSEEFTNLAESIFSDLSSVWNSSSEKKVSLYRLTSGPNGEKAFFSPNLKSSDGTKCLGYFESNGYYGRILLSEELLSEAVSYETFREVVSHEFAHFVDYIIFNHIGHDGTFKKVCEILGVENNEAVLKNSLTEVAKTSSVLEKIKKLLALSESSNINESQAALLKAQTLMREYGISERESSVEKIYRVVLAPYNSYTTEISTITHIVNKISNCWILLSQGKIDDKRTNIIYAHGTKTECELASYLFDYLKKELEYHYLQAKREQNLSYGAKKSFYLGVEHEMIKKLKTQEAETGNKALVQYDKENEEASKELIYKSTKFSTRSVSAAIRNAEAYLSGRETGRNLKIQNGITNSESKNSGFYLNQRRILNMIYEGKKEEKLSIDLSGPQGNAFYLLAAARDLGKQLKKSDEEIKNIQDDMRSSDYAHLISVFDSHFGVVMDLYWGQADLEEDDEDEDLE